MRDPAVGTDLTWQCSADLRRLDELCRSVRSALDAVDALAGPDTWTGIGSDRWRDEWRTRRRLIEAVLTDAQSQGPHLLAKARRDEAAFH